MLLNLPFLVRLIPRLALPLPSLLSSYRLPLPALPPRTIPPPLSRWQFSRVSSTSPRLLSVLVNSPIFPFALPSFVSSISLSSSLYSRAWRTCQSNTTPPLSECFSSTTRARLHVPRVSSYPLPPSIISSFETLRVSFPQAEESLSSSFSSSR